MIQIPQILPHWFVYLVDSPSHNDLYDGYSIGMALRDALNAIRIPCHYTLATCKYNFEATFNILLPHVINQIQKNDYNSSARYAQQNIIINAMPILHICTHGSEHGISLTDGHNLNWAELRKLFYAHSTAKCYNPYVCMASCNGFNGLNMASASDSAYSVLIGNSGKVLQSDVTVAYMAFYNHLFHRPVSFDQAVQVMRSATGDPNFFYAEGEQIKNQRIYEMQSQFPFNPWPNPQPSF